MPRQTYLRRADATSPRVTMGLEQIAALNVLSRTTQAATVVLPPGWQKCQDRATVAGTYLRRLNVDGRSGA